MKRQKAQKTQKEHEEYILIDANEEIVKTLAREHIDKSDMCDCEKCFLDVCAITLNSIGSQYVTSRKGTTITHALKGALEDHISIIIALSKAIEQVKANPSH